MYQRSVGGPTSTKCEEEEAANPNRRGSSLNKRRGAVQDDDRTVRAICGLNVYQCLCNVSYDIRNEY